MGQTSNAQIKEFGEFSVQNSLPSHITSILQLVEEGGSKYWRLENKKDSGFQKCKQKDDLKFIIKIDGLFKNSENSVTFVLINDFVFGSLFGASISNISVIGLYATFVFAIGKFIRIFFDKISQRVSNKLILKQKTF